MNKKEKKDTLKIKQYTYSVNGVHCASCEVLIEKKLIKNKGIKAVEASISDNEVTLEYTGNRPTIKQLNELFKSEGYNFNEASHQIDNKNSSLIRIDDGKLFLNVQKFNSIIFICLGIVGILLIYKLCEYFGLASLVSVNNDSALPAFLLYGIVAGFSSCAALVGGIVLSMSRQWYDLHSKRDSFSEKIQPHLLFNIGRILSFAILGALLGVIGSVFTISPSFTAVVTISIAILMILLGFQMLGFKQFQRFQFKVPKIFSRYIADESNFSARFMPLLMGALTFFLPCGFTLSSQAIAILSGSPIRGGLIMLLFALGSSPVLLFIGMSSTKLYEKTRVAENFIKIVGILVIFFGLSMFNLQLGVLGLPNLNDIESHSEDTKLPEVAQGKQILKMKVSANKYEPNYFKVKVGIPVRWEISDAGISGCTNAIISKELFDGKISLEKGKVTIKEFTPTKSGKYEFSCSMHMVTGIIEVVDK